MKPKEIILTGNNIYNFVGMTQRLGRAEFTLCPVYKRGYLTELYMYPLQQENIDYYYSWKGKARDLSISSWVGTNNPNIWITGYCKEHKTSFMRVYVPNNSNCFQFSELSGLGIYFTQQ